MKRTLSMLLIGSLCLSIIAGFAQFAPPANAITPLGSLNFDGSNDRIDAPPIDADTYTFMLWFKSTTNNALIGSNRFLIQTYDGSLTVWHSVYVGPYSWSASIGTGAWHHLAVVIDYVGWQITPYLDGASLGAKNTAAITKPPITFTKIGCYWNSRYFGGLIDEVKIYDRILDSSEIAYDYQSGSGAYGRPASGLAGLWHFDGDANDYSGNGNHGTVFEATYDEGHVGLPDVAVTQVTPSSTKVLQGQTVNIQVKAKNVGAAVYEDFTVSAYYDGDNLIGTQAVSGLLINSEATLSFSWNTAGVPLGYHTIKANATTVQGEADTTNNENIDDQIWIVKIPMCNFVYSPVPAIENMTTTFDASSSKPEGGEILWYNWTFGDTQTENMTTPTVDHTYSDHDIYIVTLTIVDSEGQTNTTSTPVEVLRHDILVTAVTPERDWVHVGLPLDIDVTVENHGNFTENITVDLYYNFTAGNKVDTKLLTLSANGEATLTFTWNTGGVKAAVNYTMTAIATIAFDSDTTNNMLDSEGNVYVKGTALSFDGLNDYVSVPPLESEVYTFEFWFNATSNSVIVGSDRFKIQTDDDALDVWYDVDEPPVSWSVPITTGVWHHLIVTIDYRNWKITPYLDGAELGAKYGSTMTKPALTDIKIGSDGHGAFFEGAVDEFRIYDKTMSLATAELHYNDGFGTYGRPESGLMAGYHFDDGIGTIACDYSGNDNDATIQGAAWVEGHIKLPNAKCGDVNCDDEVNALDLILVANAVGTKTGDPEYDPGADVNGDGKINLLDLILVATNLGT